MPGYSWSISASMCQTGRVLSKVEGTPCSMCYAQKGRYRFSGVQTAQDKRYRGWKHDPDWVNLMTIRLILLKERYFRWFDSGDLQSDTMLSDIIQVARQTPDTKHWLPTQERGYIKNIDVLPNNLVVRVSSTKVNDPQKHVRFNSSSVNINDDLVTCPSKHQNGMCGPCRKCWSRYVEHVIYGAH